MCVMTLKYEIIWSTSFCSSNIQIKFTTEHSNVENSKRKINCLKFESWIKIQTFNSNTVFRKKQNKNKSENHSQFQNGISNLESYNLAFKKRVSTRLEENDSNIENILCELNIQRKN